MTKKLLTCRKYVTWVKVKEKIDDDKSVCLKYNNVL